MKPFFISRFLTIVLSILLTQNLYAQPHTWDKSYHFPDAVSSYFMRIAEISDGDLLLAGCGAFSWGYLAPGFIRVDSNGMEKSNSMHIIYDSYQQITYSLVRVSDNTFYSFSFNPNLPFPVKQYAPGLDPINHSWLLKLNADGDTLACFYFDNIGYVSDMIYGDGLLIAVGSTNYESGFNNYESKTTLLITDTLGNQILRKEYLSDHDSRGNSILRLENGNYLICGSTVLDFELWEIIPDQMFLLETDSAGNVLWTYFSDIPYSQANQIIQCNDGSFVIIGDGYNTETLSIDIALWRMNTDLEIYEQLFYDLYNNTDHAHSIKQTPDGGFIVCGDIVKPPPYSSYVFFYMKLDAEGNIEWYTHNQGMFHGALDVILNGSHGYYIAGFGRGAKLVKSDLLGNGLILSSENIEKPSSSPDFEVYPNPGSHYLIVSGKRAHAAVYFKLFNNLGELVISKELKENRTRIDTERLPAGLYFYRIFSGNETPESGVWIKR